MKKFLLFSYPLLIIVLLVYSYTQVDLNLTLFRSEAWLSFQKWAQQIGYFQRPLSTLIFSVISILLFLFYFAFLRLSNQLTKKEIWLLIFSTAGILTFSYNAFSYDFFNYIFDAKIVTTYNQNPYLYRALDFPNDPMLLFMHWTHRLYPYGPTWLGLTIPLSFAGQGVFIPTFFLFKGLATALFLGTVYFIQKILKKFSPKDEKFGIVFFALNPLVIIESLVSSHNDIAMIFFMILAFYFLLINKKLNSTVYLLLSIGVKFATLFLAPLWAYILFAKKKLDFEKIVLFSILLMFAALLIATFRLNFQPWYYLYILPLISLVSRKLNLFLAGIIISVFGVFYYGPFLYFGNFDAPVPSIIFWSTCVAILSAGFIVGKKLGKI